MKANLQPRRKVVKIVDEPWERLRYLVTLDCNHVLAIDDARYKNVKTMCCWKCPTKQVSEVCEHG